jgi:hypothetical protein
MVRAILMILKNSHANLVLIDLLPKRVVALRCQKAQHTFLFLGLKKTSCIKYYY